MNGSYLVDTNIVVAYIRSEPAVVQRIDGIGSVFVPSIVLGELYFGAQKSMHVAANVAEVEQFAMKNIVLPCDTLTAAEYGNIKNVLRVTGFPIPDNDIWIAATARQHGLILVTRDAHFQHAPNLSVEAW